MSEIDNNKAGPSGTKKRKLSVKTPKNLTEEEMLQYLYDSDEEDVPDSDSDLDFQENMSDSDEEIPTEQIEDGKFCLRFKKHIGSDKKLCTKKNCGYVVCKVCVCVCMCAVAYLRGVHS